MTPERLNQAIQEAKAKLNALYDARDDLSLETDIWFCSVCRERRVNPDKSDVCYRCLEIAEKVQA